MKFFMTSLVLCFLLALPASGADDGIARAMKLYEKRHYAEAGSALRADLPAMGQGTKSAAQLTLGMIYLKNAELHRVLYQESLGVHLEYLQKLAASKGKNRSRFADLYLGETFIEAGKLESAQKNLEKFIADESVDAPSRSAAKVSLGLCSALGNNTAKADEIWAGLEKTDPETKAALAAAYSRAGLKERKPVALADESLADVKRTGAPSLRHLKNVIAVYSDAGLFEKGLEAVRKADLKAFSLRESLGKTKILHFYDVSLIKDMSKLYLQAATDALENAAEDSKLKETASFYLGEAYALEGNIDQSIKANTVFLSSSSMPPQYRDMAAVRQAANQYQKGRQSDALGKWDELSKRQPENPDLLANILLACGKLRIDCPKIAQKAAVLTEAGEGKRFSNLNMALGRYHLTKKDYARSLSYLEAGRDKSNKNKIEWNDPLLLVDLAHGYFKTKKFSEALEIYFEMSRHFPEVRQIQEALQGIYAMEHKSAGDVKIN